MDADDEIQYRCAVLAVVMAAKALHMHDIPALLEDIERAETVAPFLDPTLFLKKGKAMREDKSMLEAALPLWKLAEELKGRNKCTT